MSTSQLSVWEREANIRRTLAELHPVSRRVCCDLAARLLLSPRFDKDDVMRSWALAFQAEGLAVEDPCVADIMAQDFGTVTETVQEIAKLALDKSRAEGSFDLGVWVKGLGL